MTDARIARRLDRLEAEVDALTRALHLLTVAHKPTSEWLDKKMQEIEGTYATPPAQKPPPPGPGATASAVTEVAITRDLPPGEGDRS